MFRRNSGPFFPIPAADVEKSKRRSPRWRCGASYRASVSGGASRGCSRAVKSRRERPSSMTMGRAGAAGYAGACPAILISSIRPRQIQPVETGEASEVMVERHEGRTVGNGQRCEVGVRGKVAARAGGGDEAPEMKPVLVGFGHETDAGLRQPIADDFAGLFLAERVAKNPGAGREAQETEATPSRQARLAHDWRSPIPATRGPRDAVWRRS